MYELDPWFTAHFCRAESQGLFPSRIQAANVTVQTSYTEHVQGHGEKLIQFLDSTLAYPGHFHALEHPTDRHREPGQSILENVVGYSSSQTLHSSFIAECASHQDERDVRAFLSNQLKHFHAAASRHVEVR